MHDPGTAIALKNVLGKGMAQGIVVFQVAVDTKEHELVAAPVVLHHLALPGMLMTGDAMFTQRAVSVQIVEGGGDDLWMLKDHQPTLREEIELRFERSTVPESGTASPVTVTGARCVVGVGLTIREPDRPVGHRRAEG